MRIEKFCDFSPDNRNAYTTEMKKRVLAQKKVLVKRAQSREIVMDRIGEADVRTEKSIEMCDCYGRDGKIKKSIEFEVFCSREETRPGEG